MKLEKFLPNVFLFSSFDESELKSVYGFSSIVRLKGAEILFQEGEKAHAFYVVATGKVKIYKVSSGGLEQIVHIHKPFDLVAEASIFGEKIYPANCSTTEDSTLVKISGDGFIKLIEANPKISLKLLKSYSQRLKAFVSLVDDLSLKDVRGRVASYLLKNSVKKGNKLLCPIVTSKKELASMLGTVPETFSRAMQFFKKEGIVIEQEKTIEIKKPRKLQDVIAS